MKLFHLYSALVYAHLALFPVALLLLVLLLTVIVVSSLPYLLVHPMHLVVNLSLVVFSIVVMASSAFLLLPLLLSLHLLEFVRGGAPPVAVVGNELLQKINEKNRRKVSGFFPLHLSDFFIFSPVHNLPNRREEVPPPYLVLMLMLSRRRDRPHLLVVADSLAGSSGGGEGEHQHRKHHQEGQSARKVHVGFVAFSHVSIL